MHESLVETRNVDKFSVLAQVCCTVPLDTAVLAQVSIVASPAPRRRWPDLVWSGDIAPAVASRAVAAGELRRIARGIYVPARADPHMTVARNWQRILAKTFPGALIVDGSARAMRPLNGMLFVDHPRRTALVLPGLRIEPREGPGPVEGDIPGPEGIWMSSPARGLLDNLAEPTERLMEQTDVERWVDDLIALYGVDGINRIRDQARAIAPSIRRRQAFERLNSIIRGSLSTGPGRVLKSRELRARAGGLPIDATRLGRFEALAGYLADLAPEPLPALPEFADRRTLLSFYEAYFSNYIEGTEFTLDEAAEILFEQFIPAQRPQDAHDILGTYQLVSDPVSAARTAHDSGAFASLLRDRHGILMAGRPEVDPGDFRRINVRAGATQFMRHEQIEGTLAAGFDVGARLIDPFARALFAHFLVAEVHPFADGNGRMSRVMLNSELSAAGESRIIVPTGFRDEYITSLRAATHNDAFQSMASVLSFARRWTARMDFSTRKVAEPLLDRTNALLEPSEALRLGLRLTMP